MIDNKFNLKDKVKIVSLGVGGIILSIWVVETGIQYEVRYFWQGTSYKVYFYDWELEGEKK